MNSRTIQKTIYSGLIALMVAFALGYNFFANRTDEAIIETYNAYVDIQSRWTDEYNYAATHDQEASIVERAIDQIQGLDISDCPEPFQEGIACVLNSMNAFVQTLRVPNMDQDTINKKMILIEGCEDSLEDVVDSRANIEIVGK